MYNPQHKPNQLICGTGQTAIATGWTVKEAIASGIAIAQVKAIAKLPKRASDLLWRRKYFD